MIWYLSVCSMIGGLSVSVTTGLGAAIVTSIMGDNQVSSIPSVSECAAVPNVLWGQFKHWFMYFLLIFIAVTLGKSAGGVVRSWK
jgi:hypothetical protein